MMTMQNEELTQAIVLARLKEVRLNNNVLYRLVKPSETGTEVVSVNRLCNVIPHRRIYRFDSKDELLNFSNELLRRPLVIQPLVHFGRGLGRGQFACGMCYKDDKWVLLINQTHPKILSRLQIGLDAAKGAMNRGQSFEIEFAFSKILQKLYRERLTREEQESAAKKLDVFKSYFRYAEWEYGDLVIRYYGFAGLMGRGGGLREINTLKLKFTFEDLESEEINWKSLEVQDFPRPHLAPITEDEIREVLPEWTVNTISPLENIGDHVPEANYSYAQAGRLYDSFRKKKRQHVRSDIGDDLPERGATAARPTVSDGIELRVTGNEDERRFRPINIEEENFGGFADHDDNQYGYMVPGYSGSSNYRPEPYSKGYPSQPRPSAPPEIQHTDSYYEERGAKPKQRPQYENMYPEVKVISQGHSSAREGNKLRTPQSQDPHVRAHSTQNPSTDIHSPHANLPSRQTHSQHANLSSRQPHSPHENLHSRQPQSPYAYFPHKQGVSYDQKPASGLDYKDSFNRVQGSDRSSRSEAVDSGIASDSDHVRENSDDKTQYQYVNTQKQQSPKHPYAMDNAGYHHDEAVDVSDAMRKHKELVARMMGGVTQQLPSNDYSPAGNYQEGKQSKHSSAQYSKVGNAGMAPNNKSVGLPPMSATATGHTGYNVPDRRSNARSGYAQNASRSQKKVDESFI